MPAQDIQLLDTLVKKGQLKPEDFEWIKQEIVSSLEPLAQILLKHNLVSETDIAKARAEILKIEYLDVTSTSVSPEAINVLPEAVAEKYLCLPFSLDQINKVLSVAMADPVDLQAIEFVERKTGYKLKPYLAEASVLAKEIRSRYAQSLSTEVTEALKETLITRPRQSQIDTLEQSAGVIREAPIAKIVSTILDFAIKSRASDVHIEPLELKTRVRYRIDGILYEKLVLPKSVHDSVISRVKILSHLKIDEKRSPQDGRFNFRSGEDEVDLRVSTMPSVFGEKVVMRLLKKTLKVPALSELGLRGRALVNLENSIRVPHGIILVTGPTGSGKTTTLYSILSKINTPKVNIMTLEDPVEYQITGVTQVQVNPQAGLTFASGMRSFLRQDPNIIMVGEIRDIETAELAIQASLTGHLVFSTLHTNSAAGALPRLLDMEAESFLLASSVICIVGQRVCRQICQSCKESYAPPPAVVEDIKLVLGPLLDGYMKDKKITEIKLFRGKKCAVCNQTGYSGRIGIYEVLPITEAISKQILERAPSNAIEKVAKENGMIDMKQDGYLKALEGITTLEEILRVAET
jgi:type IV pilus assembly protein PilB